MSHDLVRQRSSTMSSPFVLAAEAGFVAFADRYAVGTPIFVGLQGFDAAGVPVAQRAVGVAELLPDGTLSMTSWTTPSTPVVFDCDHVVIVDVMSVAAVSAVAASVVAAFASTLGNAATLDVGTAAGTVAAGDDARLGDARTPTAHASTHIDGADRVSFFDLMRMERVGGYQAVSNQNITMNPFGAPAWNESGGTQRNIANTSRVTALQRRGYATAATAAAAAGGRSQAILLRDLDGFRISLAFAVTDAAPVAGARMFVGLRAATTAPTDVQIDSVINAIGVGHEAGDAGFSIFHNDAAGVATKVPLDTAKFPTANLSTDIIRVEITTQKAAGTVRVTVTNVTLGQSESVLLSTDLPALSVGLAPTVWRSNGVTAAVAAVDVFRILFDLGGGEA